MDTITFENIEKLIIELKDQKVIVDKDVAEIYGVETKRINDAVKNNIGKFPNDYYFKVTTDELNILRSKFSTTTFAKTRIAPSVFTEKGLYMLATMLKSKQATEATFAIIETFYKIRNLSRTIKVLSTTENQQNQKELMPHSGKLIAEILDDNLQTKEAETTIELNFAVLKFKYTVTKMKLNYTSNMIMLLCAMFSTSQRNTLIKTLCWCMEA